MTTQQAGTARNRPNYDKVINYIIDAIDWEGYNQNPETIQEKLQFLYDTFYSEKIKHHNNRQNLNRCTVFAEWIAGLPSSFNIAFENYRIIELAKEWNSLPLDANDRQEDKILENWFNFIAVNTFKLFRKYKIVTI